MGAWGVEPFQNDEVLGDLGGFKKTKRTNRDN